MSCLRCGRDTEENALFCQDCVQDMQDYPVPPRTAILLPKRQEKPTPQKTPRRKVQGPEEQIKKLKKQLRSVTIMMVVFAILAGILAVPTWRYYQKTRVLPGQNYKAVTEIQETEKDVSRETRRK